MKIYVVLPDHGYEGYRKPIAAFPTAEQARLFVGLLDYQMGNLAVEEVSHLSFIPIDPLDTPSPR